MNEITDPYLYPGTDVLENLRGIRDVEKLARFEARSTVRRILELEESPIKGEFNTAHLQSIHRYIFQDVFSWAGKFRTVNISKGGHSFASADFIEACLNDLFRKLAKEQCLQGLERDPFTQRLAFYLGEINAVHPFREGNGRTQREFLKQLARAAGFVIDWRGTTRDEMIAASRESFLTASVGRLVAIVKRCLQ